MAKLRVFQDINNSSYEFTFVIDNDSISSNDKDLLAKYGEPDINMGGTFDNGIGLSFTIPDEFIKLVSGLPYKKIVDITVVPWNTSTTLALALYRTTIETRVTTAFTNLRTNNDGFSNEYITTI